MSEKTTKKVGLVAKIMTILELNEEGKINKFFSKEEREFKRSIDKLKMNRKTYEMNHDTALTDLEDALEDARETVEDVKTQVTLEDISNNADMTSFSSVYWGRIDDAISAVNNIEKEIERTEEAHEALIGDIDEQIGKYQARINIINE